MTIGAVACLTVVRCRHNVSGHAGTGKSQVDKAQR
jgi:hypothetical protein